jgi:hypothetical protein
MKGSTLIGGAGAHARVDKDFYPTPPECTEALLRAFPELLLPGFVVWEPACGDGAICNVLRGYGARVAASDLVDRGYPGTVLMDFLNAPAEIEGLGAIITNPPFALASEFIDKCRSYGVPFAILHKATYWHAKSRFPLFQASGPRAVAPLLWRPIMAADRGKSPTMDFAWTVWGPEPAPETRYLPLPKP